jgi:hypothetical protein
MGLRVIPGINIDYFVRRQNRLTFVLGERCIFFKADQIKENAVGGTCDTHGRGEKRVRGFDGNSRRKKTT